MIENTIPEQPKSVTNTGSARPNDTGSISVEGYVRIFDPQNKEVFVEKRA
jgi:hypothetical protein